MVYFSNLEYCYFKYLYSLHWPRFTSQQLQDLHFWWEVGSQLTQDLGHREAVQLQVVSIVQNQSMTHLLFDSNEDRRHILLAYFHFRLVE